MKPKKIKGENASLERQLDSINAQISALVKVVNGRDIEAAMAALAKVNALYIKKQALENRMRRIKDVGFRRSQDAKLDPSFTIAR